jgi:hypothetical protein
MYDKKEQKDIQNFTYKRMKQTKRLFITYKLQTLVFDKRVIKFITS